MNLSVKEVATEVMQDAVEEIREDAGDDEITDVSISCDGTWQKRGFTSLNGAVVIISTDTGKVLDVEVMSRYCNACVMHEKLKLTIIANVEQKIGANSNTTYQIKQKHILLDLGYQKTSLNM